MSDEPGPTLFDTPPTPLKRVADTTPDVPGDSWPGFDWWWTYWKQQRKAEL